MPNRLSLPPSPSTSSSKPASASAPGFSRFKCTVLPAPHQSGGFREPRDNEKAGFEANITSLPSAGKGGGAVPKFRMLARTSPEGQELYNISKTERVTEDTFPPCFSEGERYQVSAVRVADSLPVSFYVKMGEEIKVPAPKKVAASSVVRSGNSRDEAKDGMADLASALRNLSSDAVKSHLLEQNLPRRGYRAFPMPPTPDEAVETRSGPIAFKTLSPYMFGPGVLGKCFKKRGGDTLDFKILVDDDFRQRAEKVFPEWPASPKVRMTMKAGSFTDRKVVPEIKNFCIVDEKGDEKFPMRIHGCEKRNGYQFRCAVSIDGADGKARLFLCQIMVPIEDRCAVSVSCKASLMDKDHKEWKLPWKLDGSLTLFGGTAQRGLPEFFGTPNFRIEGGAFDGFVDLEPMKNNIGSGGFETFRVTRKASAGEEKQVYLVRGGPYYLNGIQSNTDYVVGVQSGDSTWKDPEEGFLLRIKLHEDFEAMHRKDFCLRQGQGFVEPSPAPAPPKRRTNLPSSEQYQEFKGFGFASESAETWKNPASKKKAKIKTRPSTQETEGASSSPSIASPQVLPTPRPPKISDEEIKKIKYDPRVPTYCQDNLELFVEELKAGTHPAEVPKRLFGDWRYAKVKGTRNIYEIRLNEQYRGYMEVASDGRVSNVRAGQHL